MKLIAEFETVTDADSVSMQLESMGIVTHVSHRGVKSLGYLAHNLAGAGLWAVLEHQHEDAVKFVEDNTHVVTTGLSKEELLMFNKDVRTKVFSSLSNAVMYGVGIIILILIAMNYLGALL